MKPYRTIFVPTDYSKSAERALGHAVDLASACGSRVIVVHVVPPYERSYFEHVGVSKGDDEAEERGRLEAHVKKVVGRTRVRVNAELAWGDPAESILRLAKQRSSDLIVIGARGLNPWHTLVMGSVAERVVRYARCPVLITNLAQVRQRRARSVRRAA